jgi:hypothetical protein
MKLKKHLLIITLFIYGLTSCDVIEEPFTKNNPQPPPDGNTPNILLEEFTGHKCVHCPDGSQIAKHLKEHYKEKLFVVAIHTGPLAAPDPTDDRYNYDFRISEGIEMDNFYRVSSAGLPRGIINRTSYNNQSTYVPNYWQYAIADFLNKNTKQLDIELSAAYNNTTKTITADVKLNYLAAQSNQNKLSVWILEDNVIKYQKSIDTPDIPDYQHNDVFRYSFNGAWGEIVSVSTIPIGFEFSKNYSLVVSQEKDWNINNLRLIAFVYNDNNGVKQVIDTKIEIME